jgi:hypothetical protein
MDEDFTLNIEDNQLGTPERKFRTTGMYKVIVKEDEGQFREVWVDGGRYTGEKLRQIRKDGKHR